MTGAVADTDTVEIKVTTTRHNQEQHTDRAAETENMSRFKGQ